MQTKTASATAHIVQLTDCHLLADARTTLRGFNTTDTLLTVMKDLTQLNPAPELILATGDLAQDGSRAAYERLGTYLAELATPVCVIPGNHDDPSIMAEVFAGHEAFGYMETVHINEWQVIPLSTVLPGSDLGYVSSAELARVEAALRQAHGQHVLLAMHHQPVPTNMPALDATSISNAEELLELVDSCSHVRAVVWGHIHRQFEGWHNNVRLLGAPSTCFQFKPEVSEAAIDEVSPGYRQLTLARDGTVESSLRFVSHTT